MKDKRFKIINQSNSFERISLNCKDILISFKPYFPRLTKYLLSLISVFLFTNLFAQNIHNAAKVLPRKPELRCATMDIIRNAVKKDLSLLEKWKLQGEKKYNEYLLKTKNVKRPADTKDSDIIIPVVFHLVGSASIINSIPDRDIYDQVEILNRDYSGKKADKYKGLFAPEFEKIIGRINFRFVLARRSPAGLLSSGIERRITDKTFNRDSVFALKSSADGGLDPWNENDYLNVWCGTFSDRVLGIATLPSTDLPELGPQGVAIDLLALDGNPCRGYYPVYDEGATLSHEIGHYFYLFHPFGDETYCNNLDFRIDAGYPLPDSALNNDTPPQQYDQSTSFGNVSGIFSDGCSPYSYGEMYQSFMNYFDDRALYMFSEGQRQRVLAAYEIYRFSLKNSLGTIPPVNINDAYLVSISPLGRCDTRLPVVNNTPVTAVVRNGSSDILSSVTLHLRIDGGTISSYPFLINLLPGNDTVLDLASISLSQGNHTLQVYTTSPNGVSDNFSSNDTLLSYINVRINPITVPLVENFTSSIFPPSNWTINNPQEETWIRADTTGYEGAGAATVQNYDYNGPGQLDELITPPINFGTFDSSELTFKVAYAVVDPATYYWDGLEVYISNNGGRDYKLIYKKTGKNLRSVPDTVPEIFDPGTDKSKWRTEKINLNNYIIPGQTAFIKFRNTNAYGNNLFLDDISINGKFLFNDDAYTLSISNVPALICNATSIHPAVTFGSNGKDTLKNLKINYRIDNGQTDSVFWTGIITKGQTSSINLDSIINIPYDHHQLIVFTSDPNGFPDQNTANDTMVKLFNIIPQISTPVAEGFESPAFPPVNWFVENPDGGITWERSTAAAKTGIASMTIRNFDYEILNTEDRFVSSVINANNSNFDSLFVSFDYAYNGGKQLSGSSDQPVDTLELELSKDCGVSFTTLFKSWGNDLKTVSNDEPIAYERFVAAANDWRNIKIYLTPVVGRDNFQLHFVAKSNKQNDLYIDNINVFGKILPERLKKQGYLIYPNPFTSSFTIRNLEVPITLNSIGIYNSVGQLVWLNKLDGRGITEIPVNLANLSAGVYIVKLQYTDKTVIERIVKNK